MNAAYEFQSPWLLGLLALLPVYAVLRGRMGRASALRFPSVELLRTVGTPVRADAGRLRLFLRLLAAALVIVALAGPRTARQQPEIQIRPDFARAATMGVTSEALASTIRVATNGEYSFIGLTPGTYTISEQQQTGWTKSLGGTTITLTSDI